MLLDNSPNNGWRASSCAFRSVILDATRMASSAYYLSYSARCLDVSV